MLQAVLSLDTNSLRGVGRGAAVTVDLLVNDMGAAACDVDF